MKKAFPFKKRLSAVLAVVLATACFAGTVPANAAESGSYSYSVGGNHGTFEEYMWRLSDNTSGDILSFNAENQPVVTKGTGATGTEGTSLATRRIALAAGNYQLSFAVKASSQAYYIVSGYGFDSAGSPKEIMYGKTYEGSIATEWTTVTADFTVPEGYTSNEFRIFLRGNSGEQITVKDLDVKAIEEKVKNHAVATLDGWNNTNNGYSDPNETYADISLFDEGVTEENPGSVHIYTDYSVNCAEDKAKTAAIGYNLTNLTVGNTYVFEAYIKGNTKVGVADPLTAELRFSRGKWTENNASTIKFSETNLVNSTEWQKVSFKFIPSETSVAIGIGAGRYQGVDCYIDDIKVYPEGGPETNLISNGDFYESKPITKLDGWNNTNNGYSDPNETYADISLFDEGVTEENPGSVHIYTDYSVNCAEDKAKTAAIGYNLTNLTVGNTYVFEAYIKGNTKVGGADPLTAELRFSLGKWTENNASTIKFSETNLVNSTEWQKVSLKFIPSETSVAIGIGASRYQGVDCYIDDIKVYPEGQPENNLISNSTFCETESVISDSSAIDNSAYKVQSVPGFDIGMLSKDGASAAAVPGGSYDGSTALKVTADGLEGYFQTYGNESETDFPDAVKRGKIAFVKGDTAVKASGYFKKLDTSDAGAEPKVWFGFGKEYTVKKFLVSKTISSIGSHYNSESDRLDTEKYEAMDNGWVKFEMSLTDDMLASSELKTSLAEAERIRFMCGLDCDGDDGKSNYHGEALFDDVKFEIISKYALGDSNGDNAIDIRDLVHMKKYAAGTVKFTEMTRGTWLSDIGYNESPSITNEMVSMRKYLLGVTSEYGK